MFQERAYGTSLGCDFRSLRVESVLPDSPRFLQHTFTVLFRVDSIANRNYCGCSSVVINRELASGAAEPALTPLKSSDGPGLYTPRTGRRIVGAFSPLRMGYAPNSPS